MPENAPDGTGSCVICSVPRLAANQAHWHGQHCEDCHEVYIKPFFTGTGPAVLPTDTDVDLQLQPAAFICLLPAGSCDVCNAETNTFLTDAAALTAPSTPQAGANNGQAIGKKPVRKRKEAPKNKGTKKKATRYESSSDEDSLELDNQQYTDARRGGRMQVDSEEEDEEGEVILAGGTKSRPVKTKQ